jgi:hypothetical protein
MLKHLEMPMPMLRIRATRSRPGNAPEDVSSTQTLGEALHARYCLENRHLAEERASALEADKGTYGIPAEVTYSVEPAE